MTGPAGGRKIDAMRARGRARGRHAEGSVLKFFHLLCF
jgi:hypothetical protein